MRTYRAVRTTAIWYHEEIEIEVPDDVEEVDERDWLNDNAHELLMDVYNNGDDVESEYGDRVDSIDEDWDFYPFDPPSARVQHNDWQIASAPPEPAQYVPWVGDVGQMHTITYENTRGSWVWSSGVAGRVANALTCKCPDDVRKVIGCTCLFKKKEKPNGAAATNNQGDQNF